MYLSLKKQIYGRWADTGTGFSAVSETLSVDLHLSVLCESVNAHKQSNKKRDFRVSLLFVAFPEESSLAAGGRANPLTLNADDVVGFVVFADVEVTVVDKLI